MSRHPAFATWLADSIENSSKLKRDMSPYGAGRSGGHEPCGDVAGLLSSQIRPGLYPNRQTKSMVFIEICRGEKIRKKKKVDIKEEGKDVLIL